MSAFSTITFDKFQIGELYFTGPGNTAFVKISKDTARNVITGEVSFIPQMRVGNKINEECLTKLTKDVAWQEIVSKSLQERNTLAC